MARFPRIRPFFGFETAAPALLMALLFAPVALSGQTPEEVAAAAAIEHITTAAKHLETAGQSIEAGEPKRARGPLKKADKQLEKAIKVTQRTRFEAFGEEILAEVRKTRRVLAACLEAAKANDVDRAKERFDEAMEAFAPVEQAARTLQQGE